MTAALSPLRLLAAWRVEAPFSEVSRFGGLYNLRSLWLDALILQDAAPCYRKDSLYECGRPHDFIVPFLCCPMASAKSSLFDAGTANQRYRFDLLHDVADQGRRPLCGRRLHLKDLVNPVFQRLRKIPMTEILKILFQLSHIYVGGAMLFNHLKYNEVVWIRTRVSIFLMAVFDVLPGIPEVLLGL